MTIVFVNPMRGMFGGSTRIRNLHLFYCVFYTVGLPASCMIPDDKKTSTEKTRITNCDEDIIEREDEDLNNRC